MHLYRLLPVLAFLGILGLGPANAADVVRKRDLTYVQGSEQDAAWHLLDVYSPKGKTNCPVIIFVHGGFWMIGDKDFFGWEDRLGDCFARLGIVAVFPSYRLAPAVKYQDEVEDIAHCLAWTIKNIARHGGDSKSVFLCGHSAGGHLVSLLVTDPQYLASVGVPLKDIRGVIAVGGVYRVPEVGVRMPLTGKGPRIELAGRPQRLASSVAGAALEAAQQQPRTVKSALSGLRINLFRPVFGDDPRQLEQASPLFHVRPGLPPFLVVYASQELPLLPEMAIGFAAALKAVGCDVTLLKVSPRDHETAMFYASVETDPVAEAILRFVSRHAD